MVRMADYGLLYEVHILFLQDNSLYVVLGPQTR